MLDDRAPPAAGQIERLPTRRGPIRRACVVAVATSAVLASALAAEATFSKLTDTPSMSVSTATLAAPTSAAASLASCTVALSRSVAVTWTATSSGWAGGYEILRALTNGGPYLSIATVSGVATTTYTDSDVLASTTYYYVVQSTKYAWRSVNSNQASFTTPSLLCI